MHQINIQQAIIDALILHNFSEAEKLTIDAIKKNKMNAQLWLYLTQTLAFQGYGSVAKQTLERAWLLDPQAVWLEQARKDIEKYDKGLQRTDITHLLAVRDVTVCAALIVKNEEKYIRNCIMSLYDAVDEIVVVDTGSNDGTLEMLKSFEKLKIITFEWCDDFSAARNAAFPYIKSEWVFWVDADEYLFNEDVKCVRIAAGLFSEFTIPVLLRVGIINVYENDYRLISYDAVRLFSMEYGLRYTSKIHEQICINDKSMLINDAIASNPVKIRLKHFGYSKSEVESKDKINRNIKLLKQMVDEDAQNPLWYLFIGRELLANSEINEAIEYLSKCILLDKDSASFGRVMDSYTLIIKAYIELKDFDKAEAMCLEALKIRCDFPDIQYLYGLIKFNMASIQYKISEELAIKAKRAFNTYRDIISPDISILDWKADLLHGDIALSVSKLSDAKALYERAYLNCTSNAKERILKKLEHIYEEAYKI